MIVIENGSAISVDHNEYDLSVQEAAKELFEGRDVIARDFDDYNDDNSFPEVWNLDASTYAGATEDEILESLAGSYDCYGRKPKNNLA